MDTPPPADFDPYSVHEPHKVQQPSKGNHEDHERDSTSGDVTQSEADMLHFLPDSLKRFILAGSCCTGVAVLYALSSWDHGWIPGLESKFATASDLRAVDEKYVKLQQDVAELYTLSLARAIRELSADNCIAQSRALIEQIEALQYKYIARTGGRYPHTNCTKA